MKKINLTLIVIVALIIMSCSGSDTYRGNWKAMDADGNKYEIAFDANDFTIKDSTGKADKFGYSQNSVKINNGVSTYGISLDDGRGYLINFPNNNTDSVALIKDANGYALYSISRNNYLKFDDVFKFNLLSH